MFEGMRINYFAHLYFKRLQTYLGKMFVKMLFNVQIRIIIVLNLMYCKNAIFVFLPPLGYVI